MGKDLLPAIIKSGLKFKKVIFCRNEPFSNEVNENNLDLNSEQDLNLKVQVGLKESYLELGGNGDIELRSSVKEAMDLVESGSQVLVTGSLYLVAGVLTVLKQQV